MPLRNLTVIFVTAVFSLICYQKAEHNRHASSVAEAMQLIEDFYVEEVDSRELFENAMTGMVKGLDQYSTYIGPEPFKQMEEDLDQEFGGIGIEIAKKDDDSPLIVLSPLIHTPAFRAGIRAGDTIWEISGVPTVGMSRPDSVKRMRGRPGETIELSVKHAGDEKPVAMTLQREIILIQSIKGDVRRADGSWDFHLAKNPRIGYLRLNRFGKHTVDELNAVLTDVTMSPPLEAIILDLRDNAGGLLSAAVETCDAFVAKGRIVSTRGRDGSIRSNYSATPTTIVDAKVPIAVLVNGFSASASEIVAACMQDHGRAIVVGERTWGKGTVQNILELEGGRSALKLTTASYWRPSGENIHRRRDVGEDEPWGVKPNRGYSVSLNDEEIRRVVWDREKRDLFPGLIEANPEILNTLRERFESPDAAELSDEPYDDPQLQRAIEYVEEKLREIDAEARTA
ncbi:MAG TPA: S41 family peptidase [Pirellulaceae bacterium]|jgi:carboxyl-terminal processing protease|nr:S41 family peptidase [Pirellulaceae bacterium]